MRFIHPADLSVIIDLVISSVHNTVFRISVFLYIPDLGQVISALSRDGPPQFNCHMPLPLHGIYGLPESCQSFIFVCLHVLALKIRDCNTRTIFQTWNGHFPLVPNPDQKIIQHGDLFFQLL